MLNRRKIFESPVLIAFLLSICSALPSLVYGNLGFYGDDFNMRESINSFGFFGSIESWQKGYGFFYRPIGITFLLSVYSVLGDNSAWMYYFSFFIYFLVILFVYKVSLLHLEDKSLSIFITFFFSSFPFNATSYLQLSSLYMIFTTLAFLLLLFFISNLRSSNKIVRYCGLGLIWMAILFSYEQITGLILILFFLFFIKTDFNSKEEVRNFIAKFLSLTFVTLLFIFLFFNSSNNPKVTTLEDLNEKTSELKNDKDIIIESKQETSTFYSSRIGALFDKIDRSVDFLVTNTKYAFSKLFDNLILGLILVLFPLIPVFLVFKNIIRGPPKKMSLNYCFIGSLWLFGSLSPFFLYKSVHIPPYVLLLPSIGLGLLVYGLYWLVWPGRYKLFASQLYKFCFVSLFTFFQINQYGIYFGIKEELAYWEGIAENYINEKESSSVRPKENTHIFWSEKLYGHRHFLNLTGKSIDSFEVIYNQKTNSVSIIKDAKLESNAFDTKK